MQSVPQSLVAILNERKERTRLGLSKFTAEAADYATETIAMVDENNYLRGVATVPGKGAKVTVTGNVVDTISFAGKSFATALRQTRRRGD